MTRFALALALAASACSTEPQATCAPRAVYIATQGWDATSERTILEAMDEWASVGWERVDDVADADTVLTVVYGWDFPPAQGRGYDGYTQGYTIEIAPDLSPERLRVVAAHEYGHAMTGRHDHLPAGEHGVMRPAGGPLPISGDDVAYVEASDGCVPRGTL